MDELAALRAALENSNQSGKSNLVEAYEHDLASYFGSDHAVALNSGSAALEASLVSLGACSGKTILVSAAAPLPTLMPLIATGAQLRFVDSCADSPGMDTRDLESCIDSTVIAAVEVPLWGYPLDSAQNAELLRQAGVPLVEDAAHAHGAKAHGKFVGTFGSVGCFSTHHMKPLSTGEGGFVLTNDANIASRVRTYARIGNLDGSTFGRNYKPSAFTAAIGQARLRELPDRVHDMRTAADNLLSLLPPALSIEMRHIGKSNGYNLVIRVSPRNQAIRFHKALAAEGIRTDPIMYKYKVGYAHNITSQWARPCPNAEQLLDELIQLPTRSVPTESLYATICTAWANAQ